MSVPRIANPFAVRCITLYHPHMIDREFQQPVSADGQYRYVGGDQGWVLIPHEYAYRDGKWQHVDKLQHNTPAPSLEMTPEEKKQYETLYRGG